MCEQLGLREVEYVEIVNVEEALNQDDGDFAISFGRLSNIAQHVEQIRNCVADQEMDQEMDQEVQVQVVVCCRQNQGVSEQLANELNNLDQNVTVLQVRPENGGNQTWRVLYSTRSPEVNYTVVDSPNDLHGLLFGLENA